MHPADFAAIALLAGFAAALLAVLTGWGRLVRTLLRDPDDDAPRWAVDAWAGWAAGTVFLQLWHLALPLDGRAAAALALVGAAGWIRRRRPSTEAGAPGRGTAALAAAILLVAFGAVVRHMRSDLFVYDAGMYYYQAIRWLNEHPIVPGLGNLNLQLGINQTYFPWAALLNLPPLGRSGFQAVNGLMTVVAMAPGVTELLRLRRRGPPPGPVAILRILSLPVLTLFAMNEATATPSPDAFAWVLSTVVFERAATRLLAARVRPDRPPHPPLLLALLCASLVTVKLSMAVFAAVTLAVVATALAFRARATAGRAGLPRDLALVSAVAAVAGLPWLLRNIVLTGCPLFPSPVAGLAVDWRVPGWSVAYAPLRVLAAARHPGPEGRAIRDLTADMILRLQASDPGVMTPEAFRARLREAPWFGAWLRDTLRKPLLAACLAGPAILLPALGLLRRRRGEPPADRALDPLYLPVVAALAFWLHAAPAIRFGLPFLLMMNLLPAAQILARFARDSRLPGGVAAIAALLLAAAALADGFPARSRLWHTTVIAPPMRMEMESFTTRSGLVLHVPVHDARVFDAPLPATPFRNPGLSLRDPARGLAGGFKDESPPPPPGL